MNEITKVMINTAYGLPSGKYSVEDSNTTIRKYFEAELGIPEGCQDVRIIKKALRRNKVKFFEIIEETVENLLVSGWKENEFFERFVEFRNLQLGQKNLFYVPDESILTVSEFSGDHNDLRRQKLGAGSEYSVSIRNYGIKIYDEYVRFQAAIIDWSAFTNKMYEAIDRQVNDQIFEAFLGLDTVVPAGFGVTGALDLDKIVNLAEAVQIATGEDVIIAGTRPGISKLMGLTNAGWISNEMKNQRNTTGVMTYFEGIETMVVPNVFEQGTTVTKYPNNKLFVLPKSDVKPIKFVYEGDMEYTEITDKTTRVDQTMEAMIQYKAGLATVFGKYFGTYVYTA